MKYMWFVVNKSEKQEQEGEKKKLVIYSHTGQNHNISQNLME